MDWTQPVCLLLNAVTTRRNAAQNTLELEKNVLHCRLKIFAQFQKNFLDTLGTSLFGFYSGCQFSTVSARVIFHLLNLGICRCPSSAFWVWPTFRRHQDSHMLSGNHRKLHFSRFHDDKKLCWNLCMATVQAMVRERDETACRSICSGTTLRFLCFCAIATKNRQQALQYEKLLNVHSFQRCIVFTLEKKQQPSFPLCSKA